MFPSAFHGAAKSVSFSPISYHTAYSRDSIRTVQRAFRVGQPSSRPTISDGTQREAEAVPETEGDTTDIQSHSSMNGGANTM